MKSLTGLLILSLFTFVGCQPDSGSTREPASVSSDSLKYGNKVDGGAGGGGVLKRLPVVNAGLDVTVTDSDNNGSQPVPLSGILVSSNFPVVTYKLYRNNVLVSSTSEEALFQSQQLVPVGSYTFKMEAVDSRGNIGSDSVQVTVKAPVIVNTAPVVNAGADTVLTDTDKSGNENYTLKGSATDGQNNIVSYRVLRNGVQIATSLSANVTLPVGRNDIVMEATDAGGLKGTDSVVITVNSPNSAPVVNAGADSVATAATATGSVNITLKGTATDVDNNITKYELYKNGTFVISGTTVSVFQGTYSLPVGSYTFLMKATDANGLSASDSVIHSIKAPVVVTNTAPVVNAGADISKVDMDKNGSEVIALMGSATDAQNNIASYRVLLDGVQVATSLTASITVPVGSHTVMMEATDAAGLKGSDSLMVNVTAPIVQGGAGPIANAGPDITHQNDDHDGDVGESSGVETLSITTSATPGSNALASWKIKVNDVVYARGTTFPIPLQKFHFIKGTNKLTVEVTDAAGLVATDSATILVKPGLDDNPYGLGPEIKAGILSVSAGGQRILIDRDMDLKESVTMTGAVNSINPIVDYKWVWKGQILAQSSSPSILTSTFSFPLGVNRVSLQVTDSAGNTAKDGIEITVSAGFTEQLPSIPTDPLLVANNLVNASFTGTNHWKDRSAFRFRCEASHIAYDDPIVFPGQPGKAHLHMFYGNTLANGNSTYRSLRTTGNGSCDGGPLNRTAYWMPAVLNENNKVVVPDMVTIYYKKYPGTHRIPRGLKMIFGYNHAKPTTTNVWKCSHGDTTLRNTFAAVNCPATLPNGDNKVMATLGALECWDGKNLDSPDHRSHMSSCVKDNNTGACSCPATHPVSIPHFTLLVSWTHSGYAEYSKWRLSSDHVSPHDPSSTPLPAGSTFHADWFGAWDDDVMDRWIDGCIGQFKNCSAGDTGTGKRLKEVPGFNFGPNAQRLIDPPVNPNGLIP